MGELLFCHEPIASLPYYVEGTGINLYSMEELCYYIACNTYLLDDSFMGEELCSWIEHQMGLFKLAEELRTIHSLAQFVERILKHTGYYSTKDVAEIVFVIRQMEEKSDFECKKLRADHLMEHQKYVASIYEYRGLLENKDVRNVSASVVGAIWHNLGTAYARLFLFGEAISCYDRAFELNQSEESLKECLFCSLCMDDEQSFLVRAAEHELDQTEIQQLRDTWSAAQDGGQTDALAKKLREIAEMEQNGQKLQARQIVADMIFQWKEAYRRSCRV